jgi:hypothetical protein
VSGVAGEIEQSGHRLLAEDCGVGLHIEGGGRLSQPVVEHSPGQYLYSSP